ncbi:hypothetical protein MIND_00639100 [Mycena indigotica]|uniref:Uncharacterized protein n=1 Tax=Mycena indigotica TaxID=2126181 RepID=A0A8H6SSV4_9AGAR|nr:uncharacterized protein MIND_00639100 [Mycena indigotica]KAF7304076.1 hypothetical protein MIND_00639100 [Mycena indigotica]
MLNESHMEADSDEEHMECPVDRLLAVFSSSAHLPAAVLHLCLSGETIFSFDSVELLLPMLTNIQRLSLRRCLCTSPPIISVIESLLARPTIQTISLWRVVFLTMQDVRTVIGHGLPPELQFLELENLEICNDGHNVSPIRTVESRVTQRRARSFTLCIPGTLMFQTLKPMLDFTWTQTLDICVSRGIEAEVQQILERATNLRELRMDLSLYTGTTTFLDLHALTSLNILRMALRPVRFGDEYNPIRLTAVPLISTAFPTCPLRIVAIELQLYKIAQPIAQLLYDSDFQTVLLHAAEMVGPVAAHIDIASMRTQPWPLGREACSQVDPTGASGARNARNAEGTVHATQNVCRPCPSRMNI